MVLILYDLFINVSVDFIIPTNVVQLVLFIVQDICLVFQIIVLFLELFNTSTFQAGFVGRILSQFKVTIFITITYLLLCISLHAWTLSLRWEDTDAFVWGIGGYYVFYVLQRVWATLYYYNYKRTALKLGDSKF